jgi:hypothetical protein
MDNENSINDAADPAAEADVRNGEPGAGGSGSGGQDTATGTDPDAKYEEPGYQDKSFGQAVDRDQDLAEELLDETGGDESAAAERFEKESAGAPAREHQHQEGRS